MPFYEALSPIGQSVLALTTVAAIGLFIGSLKFRGIGLGTAGTLFAGLAFSAMGVHCETEIIDFAKEFGLILFVFTIGIQLGPGVIGLWRQQGLTLNMLAIAIVMCGVGLTLLLFWVLNLEGVSAVGLFSGATTNTPSLGAAQQALQVRQTAEGIDSSALTQAYAIAYPGAILGIIAALLLLKRIFAIDLEQEAAELKRRTPTLPPVCRRNLQIDNPNLSGLTIESIPGRSETGVRISRIWKASDNQVLPVTDSTVVEVGDVILAVGTDGALDRFQMIIGSHADRDLMQESGDIGFRRVVVTSKAILGKTLSELALDHLWGVTITRVIRSGVEMTAHGGMRLHYGDVLHIVGRQSGLDGAAKQLGNALHELDNIQFIPFFLGITCGIIAGLIPFSIPGFPVPVRLGLAGGPLIVAILFGMIGNLGPLAWYIPGNANRALRELGIILFLTSVGLHAGSGFLATVFSPLGLACVTGGLIITMGPLLLTGFFARRVMKMNFLTLSGLIAGSMTDPPALAFANSLSESEGASIAYAAVYPLTMTLRIISAQLLVTLCV
ncbi:MAG: putative transporter [Planctomycetaceae bacterium]|nr:putative transporter [Planctomycetaceae bacterium]